MQTFMNDFDDSTLFIKNTLSSQFEYMISYSSILKHLLTFLQTPRNFS